MTRIVAAPLEKRPIGFVDEPPMSVRRGS